MIQSMIKKDNADDIFAQMTNENEETIGSLDYSKTIQLKQKRIKLNSHYSKINIILNMKLCNNYFQIMFMIKKIEIAKEIFLQEI